MSVYNFTCNQTLYYSESYCTVLCCGVHSVQYVGELQYILFDSEMLMLVRLSWIIDGNWQTRSKEKHAANTPVHHFGGTNQNERFRCLSRAI